jgi:protein-disulfide isomerase
MTTTASGGSGSQRARGGGTPPRGARSAAAGRRLPSTTVMLTIVMLLAGVVVVVAAIAATNPGGGTGTGIVQPAHPKPVELRDGRSLGDRDAPVKIEVWADFQCPVCARFGDTIEPPLVDSMIADGTVRMTFRDLAFLGPESLDAAVGARAAGALADKFWDYHDLLFANQAGENRGGFARDRLADLAVSLGIDRDDFLAALDDPTLRQQVLDETAAGRAAGIDRTPTLTIGGRAYSGLPSWQQLKSVLEELAGRGA